MDMIFQKLLMVFAWIMILWINVRLDKILFRLGTVEMHVRNIIDRMNREARREDQ